MRWSLSGSRIVTQAILLRTFITAFNSTCMRKPESDFIRHLIIWKHMCTFRTKPLVEDCTCDTESGISFCPSTDFLIIFNDKNRNLRNLDQKPKMTTAPLCVPVYACLLICKLNNHKYVSYKSSSLKKKKIVDHVIQIIDITVRTHLAALRLE